MDARQQKAEEIANGGKIVRGNGSWLVPSQSGKARNKVVLEGLFPSCTCEDFELRERDCKHLIAVRLFLEKTKGTGITENASSQPPEPSPKVKRPTYRQDWPNYNAAQVAEKDHFQELLFDLCLGIVDNRPQNPKGGNLRLPLHDAAFAVVFKVFSTFSARRFMCDLKEAHKRGFLSRLPHYNSIPNYLEDPLLTPILHALIRQSSLPLAKVDVDFAIDSSGFCTSRFIRWFDVKWGVTREEAEWVKVHLAVGTKTNVVTAAKILDKHAADSPQFPELVKATAEGFTIREFSGDKAYAGTANFQAVEDAGGAAYIPFRKGTTGGIGGLFERAFHFFSFNRDEFLQHYHKRSNAESTFSMIKRKFGDSVRSKTDTAMMNEALAKLVCHNLSCLVSSICELGIDPMFWGQEESERPDVLPFVRSG